MKKNIWFVNQAAGSPYHGMVFRTYYLALEMVKLGHNVTIFSGSFSHNYFDLPQTNSLYTTEYIDGIRYIWVKLPKYPQSKSIGRIVSMFLFPLMLLLYPFWRLTRPNAVIVSSPPPISIIAGWVMAKIMRAKIVFEVRDIWPLSIQSLGGYSDKHPFIALLKMIERFAYRNSDFVSSVLPKAFLHFEKNGMEKDKFLYVPNGVVEEEYEFQSSNTYSDLVKLKEDGAFVIGYAGTIGIANNLDAFIKTARLLRDQQQLHFVVVGEGAHKAKLQMETEHNKLENVHFLSAVNKKQISGVIKQFDIAYVGLMKEDLFRFGISPNKVFDYMQAKRPIVMAINAGNDLVSEANCGITVPSCEPVDIAEAINNLFRLSDSEREQLGENGRSFVLENHSYAKIAANYLKSIAQPQS